MKRVGFERLAVILGSDLAQRPRTPEVHRHGNEHDGESRDAGLDLDVVKEQPLDRLVDDPNTGKQEQTGFDKRGEILHLAMSVLMVGVGRLVGDSNRHQRDDCRDQIEHGVQGFGEYAQAAGGHAHHNLQSGNGQRRQHGVPCYVALFRAHGLRTVDDGRSGHSGNYSGQGGVRTSDVRPRTSDLGRRTSDPGLGYSLWIWRSFM